ncbi:MAG: alpha-amylase family glycosyl hydrolase [Bacteroidia bacterium]
MPQNLAIYKKTLALIEDDKLLKPYESEIRGRLMHYHRVKNEIEKDFDSLPAFAGAYHYLGFHYDKQKKGWYYREWAPNAIGLSLVGDFNGWDPFESPMKKAGNGLWEIFVPDNAPNGGLKHGTRVKVHVKSLTMALDRIPAYATRVIQDSVTNDFSGQIWQPRLPFIWSDVKFKISNIGNPYIYECHVGMGQEKEGIGTWREFAIKILPRVKALGYNCLQLMAVQEHPYYASFGYHVSNFFAPSSRFGTPEDLKYLINEAHLLGIAVIMDVVHSHAIKNYAEGLNHFDGSDFQYFHSGIKGEHPLWDSKLFNYGKREVQMFLLSNLAYWLKEFHFDGFRFDGITSMLYHHHGINRSFTEYKDYFGAEIDKDALTYLRLANELIHTLKPDAITISEDMSGMPGTCRAIEEGGLGFDYRLAMGVPDFWIKLVKDRKDEDWSLNEIWNTLSNHRNFEANIAYCESHDQALVGDQTLAYRMMGAEMYQNMDKAMQSLVIDRGIALHKIIRLLTISIGGGAYLNFMGNEFGHPDWIDFPREGNHWSHKYARRQWSLVDNGFLRYEFLNEFDKALLKTMQNFQLFEQEYAQQIWVDEEQKILIYERSNMIFLLNLHVSESFFGFRVKVRKAGKYKIILNTDNTAFGGYGRTDETLIYETIKSPKIGNYLQLYLPNRTMIVLAK